MSVFDITDGLSEWASHAQANETVYLPRSGSATTSGNGHLPAYSRTVIIESRETTHEDVCRLPRRYQHRHPFGWRTGNGSALRSGDLSLKGNVCHLDGEFIQSGNITQLRRFVFAKLQTSKSVNFYLLATLTVLADDGAAKNTQQEKLADLGEVMVRLVRCRRTGTDQRDRQTSFTSVAD